MKKPLATLAFSASAVAGIGQRFPSEKKIVSDHVTGTLLSADNRSMNICIVPVPDSWLRRTCGAAVASATAKPRD